ncbi:MAG: class I SAM-dependent methyltransferase [Proteobacteria bacterium]|nr:class I SAM-dependent methyltransferase [Pseudomonadota bacterium]
MAAVQAIDLDGLLPILRCPRSGSALERQGDTLRASEGGHVYSLDRGVPDLRVPPARLRVDLPWYEPWEDLDALELSGPAPAPAPDLPYHLDAQLASVPGSDGAGRWILEVGCGERQCEGYFLPRGFHYVGSDVDHRGRGPHVMADAHNLPFRDECFDFYTSMAVYEHLASPLVAALEARRVLKPGGVIFGSAAFVYGFHDRASFQHMTHAALLWTLRSAGFHDVRVWPDWDYTDSIPQMGFPGGQGAPWRVLSRAFLKFMEWSYTRSSALARRVAGKRPLDLTARRAEKAGSLSFSARRSH